jgi:hypothetical protein
MMRPLSTETPPGIETHRTRRISVVLVLGAALVASCGNGSSGDPRTYTCSQASDDVALGSHHRPARLQRFMDAVARDAGAAHSSARVAGTVALALDTVCGDADPGHRPFRDAVGAVRHAGVLSPNE